MSNDRDNNRRKDDTSGYWRDLIISTEPPSSELRSSLIQQQQQTEKKNKKKCRGNRKRQRFRAKLRKRGLDTETISTLINDYNSPNQHEDEEESMTPDIDVENFVPLQDQHEILANDNVNQAKSSKRKREMRPTGVTTSMSQMSITKLPKKRQCSTTMNNIQEKQNNEDKATSNSIPKYLKVPDHIFKEMLSKSLTGSESFIILLDTTEKLQFVRTYAHLLNNVFYLKLEQDFWENYDKVIMTEAIWASPLDKEMAKQNNLYRINFKTKAHIEKWLKTIIDRLQVAEKDLNAHKQQPVDKSIDMNRLSTMIPAFVRRGQQKLSADFERKKRMLQFDASDHRLVKAFYNLKPTENQICLTKIIWQATKDKVQAEEEVAILKQRIYTKRLPSSFGMIDHSLDNIEQMLTRPVLNQDKRATLLSRRLKTIAQFKYDMMVLAVTTAEEIVRSHAKVVADEKNKLIDAAGGQVPIPRSLVQLMHAIAARQTNIVQRSQYILKQKLSFFDDAPTTENMAVVVGAM